MAHSAVVICPSYRLAPEFPLPFSICDAWEALEFAASESRKCNSAILPKCTDPRVGLLVGGESAGAGLAASLAHLARDHHIQPKITGQILLCAGGLISSAHVPAKYRDRYLSLTQNENAPIVDKELLALFESAFKPDPTSKLWASFDQHDPRDQGTGSVRHGHLDVAPAYFQVCGMDILRDDGLIYAEILRGLGVETRVDVYPGTPHVFWSVFSWIKATAQWKEDTKAGVGWLLGRDDPSAGKL